MISLCAYIVGFALVVAGILYLLRGRSKPQGTHEYESVLLMEADSRFDDSHYKVQASSRRGWLLLVMGGLVAVGGWVLRTVFGF